MLCHPSRLWSLARAQATYTQFGQLYKNRPKYTTYKESGRNILLILRFGRYTLGMRNPFRPSFGLSPLILAGREDLVRGFTLAFAEGVGAPLRVSLLSGARGTGKTVMLNEIEGIARSQGWIVLRANPRPGMVETLIDPTIKDALEAIDAGIGITTAVVEKQASKKTLITELRALAEKLKPYGTGILITLDEVQSAQVEELADLATAIQDLIRDEYDIAFAAAGLPEGINTLLQHEGTTFLRRAEHIQLGPLRDSEVSQSFSETVESGGREVTADAVQAATSLVRGYAYLTQVVGSLSWAAATLADETTITENHVKSIAPDVAHRMATHVHQPALKPLPDAQIEFLRAMALVMDQAGTQEAPANAVPISEIAAKLKSTTSALSMRRKDLLDSGIISSPRFGELSFALPFLKEYLLQQMKD